MNSKIRFISFFLILITQFSFSQTGGYIRILTYNILNYPENSSIRNADLKKILDEISPDIVIVQEMTSQSGVTTFLNEVLNQSFIAGPFIDGPDTDNAIFYKDSLFTFVSHIPIPTALRNISEFTLFYNFSNDTLRIYSVHLKANESDSLLRTNEVNILRSRTDALQPGSNFIVLGDFNIYRSSESAYLNLLNQSGSGYVVDPINKPGNWHNNIAFADIHTQSTCGLFSDCPNGGSGGGLDDRFDMILISQAVKDSGGISIDELSYQAYGNDGEHFNKSINDPPFYIITQEIANSLYNSSDHLPVFADFRFGTLTNVNSDEPDLSDYALYQNYPNPFNPGTTIKYSIPRAVHVELSVYNNLGEKIIDLVNMFQNAGIHSVVFNSENLTNSLSSGVYFYRLLAGEFYQVKKFILTK